LIPVFTAILSSVLRIEAFNLHTIAGKFKFLGIVLCLSAATMIIVMGGGGTLKEDGGMSAEMNSGTGPPHMRVLEITLPADHNRLLLGCFCLFANTICFSCYLILQPRVLKRFTPMRTNAYTYMTGCTILGVILFISNAIDSFSTLGDKFAIMFQGLGLGGLMYAVIVVSCINYGVISWVNKRTKSPSLITIFVPFQVGC
jgi:drug/metabolite transporter (DMT)-like permease